MCSIDATGGAVQAPGAGYLFLPPASPARFALLACTLQLGLHIGATADSTHHVHTSADAPLEGSVPQVDAQPGPLVLLLPPSVSPPPLYLRANSRRLPLLASRVPPPLAYLLPRELPAAAARAATSGALLPSASGRALLAPATSERQHCRTAAHQPHRRTAAPPHRRHAGVL